MRVTMMHTILRERTSTLIQLFITLLQPDGRYMVRLLEPLELSKEAFPQQITQTCWEWFEPTIRQHPEQ
jgi:lauroyl/myristoyl acyltransferase